MKHAPERNAEHTPAPSAPKPATWVTGDGLVPGDAYTEGPYVVFTEQYHRRRGYCCNSDCRHCPYKSIVD